MTTTLPAPVELFHRDLACGAEFAADVLPDRSTVAIAFRLLSGAVDDPPDRGGQATIVEHTLSKGTRNFDGKALADAFDACGIQWGTSTGRQSMVVRALCLPEFVERAIDLVAEMLCRPTFPDEAVSVALELAQQDLKQLEDDPGDLVRVMIQRLTLGPVLGRHAGGDAESLTNISPASVREHWKNCYHAGRLQCAVAGAVDVERLAAAIERNFADFGSSARAGRAAIPIHFESQRQHRMKDLKQQYIAITMLGTPRDHPDFATEQVLIGVLAGGMSGRLFTEVREKQGLVYWVGAWHEQPRGVGVIHLGASTTPERCNKTYQTLLREIERIGEDLTIDETERAKNQIIAHWKTEDDLTRARAG
ncbi:MAG: insulinase family protein, partial [Phycisphaerales bacterium]|nr:insulinase family protein [Phycisphaerales bacterium]